MLNTWRRCTLAKDLMSQVYVPAKRHLCLLPRFHPSILERRRSVGIQSVNSFCHSIACICINGEQCIDEQHAFDTRTTLIQWCSIDLVHSRRAQLSFNDITVSLLYTLQDDLRSISHLLDCMQWHKEAVKITSEKVAPKIHGNFDEMDAMIDKDGHLRDSACWRLAGEGRGTLSGTRSRTVPAVLSQKEKNNDTEPSMSQQAALRCTSKEGSSQDESQSHPRHYHGEAMHKLLFGIHA